jgi:hypothetical protein
MATDSARVLDAIGKTPLVELRRIVYSGLRYLSGDVFRPEVLRR